MNGCASFFKTSTLFYRFEYNTIKGAACGWGAQLTFAVYMVLQKLLVICSRSWFSESHWFSYILSGLVFHSLRNFSRIGAMSHFHILPFVGLVLFEITSSFEPWNVKYRLIGILWCLKQVWGARMYTLRAEWLPWAADQTISHFNH